MSLQEGPCWEEWYLSWYLQLLHLWNLPQHLHGSHALPRMLLANGWAQWVYWSWGIPAQHEAVLWVVFAPELHIHLAEMFSEQYCIWDTSYPILIPPFSSLVSDPHHSQKALLAYSSSLSPWPIFLEDLKDIPFLSLCLLTCPIINDCRIYIY